jgi:altronate dehydratase large subunit
MKMGFPGYVRPDGSVGIRNHVAVISSVSCVNGITNAIAREVPEVRAITHTEGCGRGLADVALSSRTLAGLGKNPNVYGAIVIGLGCEFIKAPPLAEQLRLTGRPVECLVVQERGGSRRTAEAGIKIARQMVEDAGRQPRTEAGWDKFVFGLKCGGSDALSGVTANPMVGRAADWLVAQGATVILSETTEMIGAEQVLARRAAEPEMGREIVALVGKQRELTHQLLGPFASLVIAPGNMDGGLSNIAEKSLGCVTKGGTTPVRQIVEYATAPTRPGLVIMDGPGSDIFCLTGLAASGAHAIVFTTGRGTPAGFPLVPVIKVATNSALFAAMEDDMDLNAGRVLEGLSLDEVGQELVAAIESVAAGQATKAEINRQDCIAIHTVGPAF